MPRYKHHLVATVSITILFFGIQIKATIGQTRGTEPKGYGKAHYTAVQRGSFMKTWLVAGPFLITDSGNPDGSVQEKVFKTDEVSSIVVTAGNSVPAITQKNKTVSWQEVSSPEDVVDLDGLFKKKDFAYAYALAEIKSATPTTAVLAVGSDDGIRIWHNGKLIHDNWLPRGIVKDNDLVALKLIAGSNQILVKVQDINGEWGFIARLLDKASLNNQLVMASGNGDVDKMNLLIEGGADINSQNEAGITPLIAAKVNGRSDITEILLKKGAKNTNVVPSEMIIDNYYTSLKDKEGPGIAVLVAKDGQVLYRKGFGFADVQKKIKVTPETKFRIGSVTKQFTAAAILKLQEANLLSINDKLSKFIPDYPRGNEVTIHHLLTHTSGIQSYTGKGQFVDRVTKTITPDSLIAEIKRDAYDFNPGEKMQYNNSGYFLLGYIISKVSGKTYADYLKQTFFDPVGMENTGIHFAGISLAKEAKGYVGQNNKYEAAVNWDMSWAGAAGAMYSTVDDLMKWNEALYNGKVISSASLKAALTPAALTTGEQPSMQYGYGLALNKYRGKENISHGGGLHGFTTQLAYYPNDKMTVVMFTNTSQPEVNFDPNKIAEAYLWDKMEIKKSYTEALVKPASLQVYTGRYDLMGQAVITVTTLDDKLYAQLTGQPKFQIFPSTENEFFWKVVEARIKFIKDSTGNFNNAVLFQNGQEMKVKRLAEEKIAEIDPAILDRYTGKYKLNDNITVVLTKENNKLFAEPTGQPKVELLPLSPVEFVIMELNAKISFVSDDKGKVTMFKLNMNGRNTELPKLQ